MDIKEVQRGKRRGWIKNAAIIFLAIMLVLTFFSNTIMNRSLPEVASQYVTSGTISAKIRGTGTVAANSAYDVKVKENRVIKTVAVRKGDTVDVGDVLFLLEEGESTTLQELRDQLDDAKYNYRLLLLNSPYINTSTDNREIERLREKLDEAIEERDLAYVTDSQIQNAESAAVDREIEADKVADRIEEIDEEIAELNEKIAGLGGAGGGDIGGQGTSSALIDAYNDADIQRQTMYLVHRAKLLDLYYAAELGDGNARFPDAPGTYYFYNFLSNSEIALMTAKAHEIEGTPIKGETRYITDEDGNVVTDEDGKPVTTTSYSYDSSFTTALESIQSAEKAFASAKEALDKAKQDAFDSMMDSAEAANQNAQLASLKEQLSDLNTQKKGLEKEKKAADRALEEANALVETLKEKKANYKSLSEAVKLAEDALEDKILSVQESQHSTTVEKSKYDLDVEKAKKGIDELQEKIDKAETGEGNDTITAPVAGTVTAINISAGSTTEYDVSLMTIEEKDRGYMVSFSVTNEQAQKVKIGDSADVTSNYWGASITATLAAITNDPANPGKGKLLNFVVEGDVSAGDQLNLAIGQKSMNYELIVPNSAVRSDANGYFVLIVQTKSSPLGNRYAAARVDVQVLASDDTNTAVSGGLVGYDYVITTSSAPLTPGQLVRLVEN